MRWLLYLGGWLHLLVLLGWNLALAPVFGLLFIAYGLARVNIGLAPVSVWFIVFFCPYDREQYFS